METNLIFNSYLDRVTYRLLLRRGRESTLAKLNIFLERNEICCTIPDDATDEQRCDKEYLRQNIFKYKIGDGIHRWNDLEYQEGTHPVAMVLTQYDDPVVGDEDDDNV